MPSDSPRNGEQPPNDEESPLISEQMRDSILDGAKRARNFWDGFIDFAMQGNILEIAFGLMLAAAFTTLVKSFVQDILMPPISVLLPLHRNIDEKFAVLRRGPNYDAEHGYNTLAQAQADGAVVMAYGVFIGQLVSFFGIGISLYGLAHFYQWASHDPIIKHTVKCPYCRKLVNEKSTRCINCTSWLDGREDRHR